MDRSIGTSLVLLLLAIVTLWLAVTGRLGKILDAWDYVRGNTDSLPTNTATSAGPTQVSLPKLSIPSIPINSYIANVQP